MCLTKRLGQGRANRMSLQVNIGEAKTRLSELVAAAVRGEEVILAKAGEPQVRLVVLEGIHEIDHHRRLAKRRAAIGMFADAFEGYDTSVDALKADRDPDRRERKIVDGAA